MKKCEYCAKEISYHEMYCGEECQDKANRFYDMRDKFQKFFAVVNGICVLSLGISIFLFSFLRDVGAIAMASAMLILGVMYFFLPFPPDVMIQKYKLEKSIKISRLIAGALLFLGILVLVLYLTRVI